jgi:hypothetical protein
MPDPYVYPGDAAHLDAAIAAASFPVNPKVVRGIEPYHHIARTLASASVNPDHALMILLTVRPHYAALQVAYETATALVTDVAKAFGLTLDDVIKPEPSAPTATATATAEEEEEEDEPKAKRSHHKKPAEE